MNDNRLRVILDCDPGNGVPGANVDDGLAIALAIAAESRIDLAAITTVSGNTSSRTGYSVARTMLEDLGVDIPLYCGAERALQEPDGPWRSFLDAPVTDPSLAGLWDGVPYVRDFEPQGSVSAAAVIAQLAFADPGNVTIVAIGPLTNIAHAILVYPELASALKEIVIMGGSFNIDGTLKDTNFGVDPEAARIVLRSGAPITLVPLDASEQTMLTLDDLAELESIDNDLSRCILPWTRAWLKYSSRTRGIPGCWLHDPLAVAILLDRSIAHSKEYMVDVELNGTLTRGRSIRWVRDTLRTAVGVDTSGAQSIEVLTHVDNRKLVRTLIDAIRGYGT
ncbi:nucleoside hydrolase [Arthrobacter bambusae]|jgi:inosine-uridine nucleoside N-ribohydrolase|uniref:nucleoside hydrolase n=1 Tax=Arthrobacter bambusae TaxID=1338426 RepID=UPI0027D919C3|nr:nucleoside hydrolase [Arthrobacter bambusae]